MVVQFFVNDSKDSICGGTKPSRLVVDDVGEGESCVTSGEGVVSTDGAPGFESSGRSSGGFSNTTRWPAGVAKRSYRRNAVEKIRTVRNSAFMAMSELGGGLPSA